MACSFIAASLKITAYIRNREVLEGWILVLALAAELVVLVCCWLAYRRGYPDEAAKMPVWTVFITAFALVMYRGLEFFLHFSRFVMPQPGTSLEDFLVQLGGALVGLILSLLTGYAVYRVAVVLPVREQLFSATAIFLVTIAQQMVVVVQVLLARGILPLKKWLFAMMIPLINHPHWFFYCLLAVTLLLPVFLLLRRKPAQAEGLNPAQYRKLLAAARRQLRWGGAVLVSVMLVLGLATVGKAYADQKVELSPAVPVVAVKGEISIPLEIVADGKLHRFGYTASNGTAMRFIIIKKGGSAYGVGLDACDICGPTGYYERDGQVVCALCDVVMNKATIGFKGGCNPVPIEHKVAAGKIVIPQEAMEKERKRFR